MFDELSDLFHGVGLLKELSVRSLDAIASFGEILSCMQIAAILNDCGITAEFVDSRRLVRTDARFGEARSTFHE
jgi:aspartokinase/homoserine dehydrogenase 1